MWRAADDSGTFSALVKMLLSTAQRREKVPSMRWDDVVDGGVDHSRRTTRKGHARCAETAAGGADIIAAQTRIAGNPYIFAGSLHGRPTRDLPKDELPSGPAAFSARADLPHWTLHDLRCTARSL